MTLLSEEQAKEALVLLEQKAQRILDREEKNQTNRHIVTIITTGCVSLINKPLTTRELRIRLLDIDADMREVGQGEAGYSIPQSMISLLTEYRDFLLKTDIVPPQSKRK